MIYSTGHISDSNYCETRTGAALSCPYLVPESLLVAHDGGGVVGVLLLQVLQKGLPLAVHVVRLHGHGVPGAARAAYCVASGKSTRGPGVRVVAVVCAAAVMLAEGLILRGGQPLVAAVANL